MISSKSMSGTTVMPYPEKVKAIAGLDAAAYHSLTFARREDGAIWSRDWIVIGTQADAPDVGDLLPFTVGNHAVHIQRTAEGGIIGRFNQAQHGGCRVVPLQCQQGTKTPCSFTSCGHSLDRLPLQASELGGTTREMHQYLGLRPERLLPVRTAILGPLLFVNLDPLGASFDTEAMSLRQTLPELTVPSLQRVKHCWIDYAGNWKLVGQQLASVAAESVMTTHDNLAITSSAQSRAVWCFPNLLIFVRPDSLCLVVLQPIATNRTRCRVSVFCVEGQTVRDAADSWLAMLDLQQPKIERTQRALEAFNPTMPSTTPMPAQLLAGEPLGAWVNEKVLTCLRHNASESASISSDFAIPIRRMQ